MLGWWYWEEGSIKTIGQGGWAIERVGGTKFRSGLCSRETCRLESVCARGNKKVGEEIAQEELAFSLWRCKKVWKNGVSSQLNHGMGEERSGRLGFKLLKSRSTEEPPSKPKTLGGKATAVRVLTGQADGMAKVLRGRIADCMRSGTASKFQASLFRGRYRSIRTRELAGRECRGRGSKTEGLLFI